MYTLFLVCAVVGGTIFLLQFVLAVMGADTDDVDLAGGHDLPHDFQGDLSADTGDLTGHGHGHGSTWMFGVISFRTIVAALTFFGLAGLASQSGGLSGPVTLLTATGGRRVRDVRRTLPHAVVVSLAV